jgi:deoxyadenosine/deoxycytidine kinase
VFNHISIVLDCDLIKIILAGVFCVGKSTAGKVLADEMGY